MFARGKVFSSAEMWFCARKSIFSRGEVFFLRAEKCGTFARGKVRFAEKYVLRAEKYFCARKSIFARGKVFLRALKYFRARKYFSARKY